MATKAKQPWELCKRCSRIPGGTHSNMAREEEGSDDIVSEIMELPGIKGVSLTSGYKEWDVVCEICGTRYSASVDVEPFVWDFSIVRANTSVHPYGGFSKENISKEQYDFEALKYATKVEIFYNDDTSKIMNISDYWYTRKYDADLVEGSFEGGGGPDYQYFFPAPNIVNVKILSSQEEENHGSHPSHGQTFPTIDEWYLAEIDRINT